jgi:hypothetical protein
MSGYPFALALCVLVVGLLFFLLRTRRIREKYAGIWIVLATTVVLLGLFPGLAVWVADLVGVETPSNLVFASAFVVLLLVCIQLSTETSQLEEETRTLAEELALLRLEFTQFRDEIDRRSGAVPDSGQEPSDGTTS